MGKGIFSPLWISLEGFLEESVLNLSESTPSPSHPRFLVTSMPLPSAGHAPPMTLEGRREGCWLWQAWELRSWQVSVLAGPSGSL